MTADNGKALALSLAADSLDFVADYFAEKGEVDRLEEVLTACERIEAQQWLAALNLLANAERFFDGRMDVEDGDYGVPRPNQEMRLFQDVRQVRALMSRLIDGQPPRWEIHNRILSTEAR